MKTIAAVLLAMIAAVHYGSDLLAFNYVNHDLARKILYYILRSFEGAIQYALIAVLVLLRRADFLGVKAKELSGVKGAAALLSSATWLVVVVCCWGALEHLQAGACRLSLGVSNRVPTAPPLTGICDDLTGLPMYALGLGVVAFIAAVIAAHPREQ